MNTSIIRNAIANKEVIEFAYHGYPRVAEPHVYGKKDGKRQILVYQIGGSTSSGKIPDWQRINLDEMSGLRVVKGQKFAGPRDSRSVEHGDCARYQCLNQRSHFKGKAKAACQISRSKGLAGEAMKGNPDKVPVILRVDAIKFSSATEDLTEPSLLSLTSDPSLFADNQKNRRCCFLLYL